MTVGRGSNGPKEPHEGPAVQPSLDLARVEADLETRAGRLQRFVEGLGSVLDRFEASARSDDPGDLLADFDAPDASHEAFRVLTEASTATRHDLAVLRTDIRTLIRASARAGPPAVVGRIHATGQAAEALKTRFESFRGDTDGRLAARGAGPTGLTSPAAQTLQRFVAIAIRTLQDLADAALRIEQEDGHLGLLANATATGAAARTVVIPPPPQSTERRRPAALLAMAAAGGVFSNVASRLGRGAVGPLAAGATLTAVILVAIVASSGPPAGSGALTNSAGASGAGAPGESGGVAVASTSPGASSDASPGTSEPAVSLLPGQTPPPPTLRPGTSPGPGTTLPPGATPAPSTTPTATPPGVTPPPPTPVPTPTPTLEPGAAADQFAARVNAARTSIDTLLSTISTALGAQPPEWATIVTAANDIAAISAAEQAWLDAHPPAACYQADWSTAQAKYGELIGLANEMADAAAAADAAMISGDVGQAHQRTNALKQAANKAVAACP